MEYYLTLYDALNKLVEHKILIMACPMFVNAAGIEFEDLRDGVIIAEKEKFFKFTKGRIFNSGLLKISIKSNVIEK